MLRWRSITCEASPRSTVLTQFCVWADKATPANITQEQAIAMAARNGRISFFGGLPKNDPFIKCDSNLVHYRQLHIHGANGSSPDHNKRALEYISTGQVPVKDLITKKVALGDVMSVFDIVAKGEAIKVTVEP